MSVSQLQTHIDTDSPDFDHFLSMKSLRGVAGKVGFGCCAPYKNKDFISPASYLTE